MSLSRFTHRGSCHVIAALSLLVALAGVVQGQTILHVDGDTESPTGDGMLWSTAFKYLQDALTDAPNHLPGTVQIWVAATDPGNPYRPDRSAADPDGTRDRQATFRLAADVELYGGFLGVAHPNGVGETLLAQSNPELNETVLTGRQPTTGPPPACGDPNAGSCFEPNPTPGCDDPYCCSVVCIQLPACCLNPWDQGCAAAAVQDCPGDAYHVVSGLDSDDTMRLDGFTITGGVADHPVANDGRGRGGGIFLRSTGQFGSGGLPLIARCTITGNYAVDGGGMYIEADLRDQGLFPQVVVCSFIANEAEHDGGAVHIGVKAGGTFINCLFVNNEAWNNGGAMYMLGDKLQELINCTVSDNTADSDMDGAGDGGGVFIDQNNPTVVLVKNTILWANVDSGPVDETAQLFVFTGAGGGSVTVSHSDIDGTALPPGATDGGGNIFVDPLFVNPVAGDYRLGQLCSRCIDRADNFSVPPDDHDVNHDTNTAEKTPDLDILDRETDGLQDGTAVVDMGAYEFVPPGCPWDCGDFDGTVGIVDFLALLGQWGQQCTSCDFGLGDPGVGINEFLELLDRWFTVCPLSSAPPPLSLEQELADACLTEDEWDEYVDVMTDEASSQADKDRYDCWMRHYIIDCSRCSCPHTGTGSGCPNPDPFN